MRALVLVSILIVPMGAFSDERPTEPTKEWYGLGMLVADVTADLLYLLPFAGAAKPQEVTRNPLVWLGTAMALVDGPIAHVAAGRQGWALLSLGVRVLGVGGLLVGLLRAEVLSLYGEQGMYPPIGVRDALPFVAVMGVIQILDAASAVRTVEHTGSRVTMRPIEGGFVVGLTGTF